VRANLFGEFHVSILSSGFRIATRVVLPLFVITPAIAAEPDQTETKAPYIIVTSNTNNRSGWVTPDPEILDDSYPDNSDALRDLVTLKPRHPYFFPHFYTEQAKICGFEIIDPKDRSVVATGILYPQNNAMIMDLVGQDLRYETGIASEDRVIDGSTGKTGRTVNGLSVRKRILADCQFGAPVI
jgi:hypothetical protein